jgi:serine/threonine protein kinase
MQPKIFIPQHGGKMLAQGHYGCIFDPPLICRGEKQPRGGWRKGKLGKLTEISDIKNEIMAAELFTKKPEARKYFILPELDTLCPQGDDGQTAILVSEQKERDFGKCEALQRDGMGEMLHYQMEYGGKTLQEKLGDIEAASKNFPFYKFMGEMLEIGAYLLINGLIHNDLHSANIMMNKDYRPRLIDFGRAYYSRSITEQTLEELAAEYSPSLGQITPECSTQDGLESGIPFTTIVQDLISQKPGLLYAERLFGQSRQKQMAEFQKFWMTSKSVQQKDFVSFWRLYWPVVDAWSIGQGLASTLYKLSQSNNFMKSPEWLKRHNAVKAVITGLLKASPRQRLDCMEALALYDPMNDLVSSPSGKAWLEKKQAQREKLSA